MKPSLRTLVQQFLEEYLLELDDVSLGNNFYELVLSQVEPAIFEAALKKMADNQQNTANLLGISRTTLRKKIAHYQMRGEPADVISD